VKLPEDWWVTMTKQAQFRLTLAEDRNSVKLETVIDGEVIAWGTFAQADELDAFIDGLRAARQGMAEQVPLKLDPMPRLPTEEYPNWWVFDPTPQGRTLALRHRGFGWLAFLFSPEQADRIAEWLKKPYQP
jgi:hypothetical protein